MPCSNVLITRTSAYTRLIKEITVPMPIQMRRGSTEKLKMPSRA